MKFLVKAVKVRNVDARCGNNCGSQRNCIDNIVCPFK